MRWSKLKQRIEQNFADSLKGNLEIFAAVYNDYDKEGRVWFTLDKIEIANFCDFESWNKNAANYHESTVDRLYKTHSATKNEDRTDGLLVEKGEFSKWDLYIQMFDYLNLSIDNALNHSSPVINAIAVADKRTGKRRLAKLHFDHPLPMKILNERLKREDTNNRQHRI